MFLVPDPSLPAPTFGIYYVLEAPLTPSEYRSVCQVFSGRFPGIQIWLTRHEPPFLAVQLTITLDARQRAEYARMWDQIVHAVRPNATHYTPSTPREFRRALDQV